ncbi:MoaD/ThiS family protein [SAR202 cluster bacterium AD-804-J14_MRT_500m]|nr:MoaD/ThiS family protein [SAR202 cluster bacterium AD-804-J14_MRT_500m]
MKIFIRNPQPRTLELTGKRKVRQLLTDLELNAESHIVIRHQELLTNDVILYEDDEIEVISAISGG